MAATMTALQPELVLDGFGRHGAELRQGVGVRVVAVDAGLEAPTGGVGGGAVAHFADGFGVPEQGWLPGGNGR